MKKIVNILSIFSIVILYSCNNSLDQSSYEHPPKNNTQTLVNNPRSANNSNVDILGELAFKDTLHDFGKVKQGEVVEYDFEYTNKGKSPLLITDAHASCGCTVPDFSNEPLEPNKSALMKVKFNSDGKHGFQHKTVIVKNNGKKGEVELTINAVVE